MKTTMFWSCTGIDASELSFGTAKLLSDGEKTLIAELPCLGIPRLGFACGVMDRGRNTEAAITQFEQGKSLQWDMVYPLNRRFAVLPASVFATPDYPVATKVNINTLIGFIPALQKLARNHECSRLILECQGQLNSPMTFFSLKAAEHVVIPLGKPTDTAYALASIRRLVQIYKHHPGKFILAAVGNVRAIERAAFSGSTELDTLEGLRVIAWDRRKIRSAITKDAPASRTVSRKGRQEGKPRGAASWGALLRQEAAGQAPEELSVYL
ncbi:MAG: hypothetical protein LBH09_00515 [Peptococcaceae bacterium]|jgi:hypothetical protein|nr:hypothetical protein [Peptococcaceae bacterium]